MAVAKLITTLTGRRKEIFDKIMSNVKIDHNTGCWEWQGGTSGSGRGGGYGRMSLDGGTVATHITMFINFFGAIPPKKQIDHKCNNRICCNPDHLEMVTHKQNQKRRDARRKS
ncbi:endonuclease [Roseobacter phage RD-1410W1-01]|uniref:HNH endonuclease n=1 Tax=Roseobacter phage RD-1410W1-01 TaxID=1815984 RepID=A0A191VYJ6_9CAUD|nr:endonuclease [Roseobacter phage RD-1410W1-01]ANJ20783.1 HNH endonuclease [Roseobacter phage RD-1410W1-01]